MAIVAIVAIVTPKPTLAKRGGVTFRLAGVAIVAFVNDKPTPQPPSQEGAFARFPHMERGLRGEVAVAVHYQLSIVNYQLKKRRVVAHTPLSW
jgi:hypothetical protein